MRVAETALCRAGAVLVLLLLAPAPASSAPAAEERLPVETSAAAGNSGTRPRAALEVGAVWLPPGASAGGQVLFARLFPVLSLDGGEEFALTLGAPLHLRLLAPAPLASNATVRQEDWDELSDFGQLVRELRLGSESGRFSLHAGPLSATTLGHGHLVGRYSNQLSPDYHPAGAALTAGVGPVRVEALASDVLAARLFAAQVGVALDSVESGEARTASRYHLSVAAARDLGLAGGRTPALTLAQVGADAALYQSERLRVVALASGGARVDVATPEPGLLLGLAVMGSSDTLAVNSRWEARWHGGSFRFGLFGADYELARFASTGLSGVPLAEERLPRGLSGRAELSVARGGSLDSLHLSASLSVEAFSFGRTDADLALHLALPGGGTSVTTRLVATGLGTGGARSSARVEVIQRLLSSVYAWSCAALLHLPRAEGHLERGWSAGAGVGYGR